MCLFIWIVEWCSFICVVQDLVLFCFIVIEVMQWLEVWLGVCLFECIMCQVCFIFDGEVYYQCCMVIFVEIEEVEVVFIGVWFVGLLWVDVQGILVQYFMLFDLFVFFVCYFDIQLCIGVGDCYVDLVCEGVDCVLCVGCFVDNCMVGWQIVMLVEGIFVSFVYLVWYGILCLFDELDGYCMIGFEFFVIGGVLLLEFC